MLACACTSNIGMQMVILGFLALWGIAEIMGLIRQRIAAKRDSETRGEPTATPKAESFADVTRIPVSREIVVPPTPRKRAPAKARLAGWQWVVIVLTAALFAAAAALGTWWLFHSQAGENLAPADQVESRDI